MQIQIIPGTHSSIGFHVPVVSQYDVTDNAVPVDGTKPSLHCINIALPLVIMLPSVTIPMVSSSGLHSERKFKAVGTVVFAFLVRMVWVVVFKSITHIRQ